MRYQVAEVDGDFCLFDTDVRSPITYILMVRSISNKPMNAELILTSYDATEEIEQDYYVFHTELWSTQLYVKDLRILRATVYDVIDSIQTSNLALPISLAYAFGGHVVNTKLTIPVPRKGAN